MTPTSRPVSSRSWSRRRAAEASGSTGRRTSVLDPGRGADEAVLRLRDDERASSSHDPLRLAEDHVDLLVLVRSHDAALDLGDRLLRDGDHVAVLQLGALLDHLRQVVAFTQLGEA